MIKFIFLGAVLLCGVGMVLYTLSSGQYPDWILRLLGSIA